MSSAGIRFDDCEAKGISDLALLVYIPDLDEEVWIPQSQIHADSEVFNDDEDSEGTLVVKRWWAGKQKWI